MTTSVRGSIPAATIAVLIVCGAALATHPPTAAAGTAPYQAAPPLHALSDAEFWSLASDISEPGGFFRITDNFTSNELEVGRVFTMLRERGVSGGVYLGVGPEQNLTYIAAIRPVMAFVVDIRRQAVMQHLLFKAVFELARDRADFISLLFSKPRPENLDGTTPIQRIWNAYAAVATDRQLASKNAVRIVNHLTRTHRFLFTAAEAAQLESVRAAFVLYGPDISTRGWGGVGRVAGGGNGGTFADLTGWAYDDAGEPQSFLSTEENFRFVKGLHEKNLLVPVSGDFGGPKAIRAIAAYLQKQGAVVSAFYLSNVEQYLFQDGKARAFYDNVAALPVNETSVFIRPYSLRRESWAAEPLCPIPGFIREALGGRVVNNGDALACIR
ncbi:MAG: hypothetical protein ABI868_20505 [Acidobacteriota bacterium]